MSLNRLFIIVSIVSFIFSACATRVTRIPEDEIRDLSGTWNDTDSQMVAKEMIGQLLSEQWLTDFKVKYGKNPVVIVGTIRNKSHEHVNLNTFIYEIERNIINSNRVSFVASEEEREKIRAEREDMDSNAREDTRKEMGHEIGADYLLLGEINTIIDALSRNQVRYYQINLDLIDLSNNVKVWVGQKKIKKYVQNSKIRS